MEKYLTFDCYGTLINTAPIYDYVAELGQQFGIDGAKAKQMFMDYENSPANFHPYVDYDLLVRNNLMHLDQTFNLTHQFEEHYVELLTLHRELKPFPEVVETLAELRSRGYQLMIMSNSAWNILPANVKALANPFADVVTAEDVHDYKPDLQFFNYMQRKHNFTSENHWHVAKGYGSDIVPANQMHWPVIWVNRQQQAVRDVEPTEMVSDLEAVLDLLK